jgi:hypothetical protein
MTLWIMMFTMGILGFVGVTTKITLDNKRSVKPRMFMIEDEYGEKKHITLSGR